MVPAGMVGRPAHKRRDRRLLSLAAAARSWCVSAGLLRSARPGPLRRRAMTATTSSPSSVPGGAPSRRCALRAGRPGIATRRFPLPAGRFGCESGVVGRRPGALAKQLVRPGRRDQHQHSLECGALSGGSSAPRAQQMNSYGGRVHEFILGALLDALFYPYWRIG